MDVDDPRQNDDTVPEGLACFPFALAASLDTILGGVDAVCEDLDFRTAFACPTFRVGSMRVGAH